MEIGVLGYPKTGKTTVFNALTRGHAETASYVTGTLKPNVGMAKVPDKRLDGLVSLFHPQRLVPAEVQYSDIPGVGEDFGASMGIHGELLNLLQRADALLHVTRNFHDPALPYPKGGATPQEAIPGMELELALVDLEIIGRRLERLSNLKKGAKPNEIAGFRQEESLLSRLKTGLEGETPVREQELSDEERKILNNYQLLTAKPMVIVLNVGEEALDESPNQDEILQATFGRPKVRCITMGGKLEMELAQLSPREEEEFRQSLGAGNSGRENVLRISYELLGLIPFFTVGPDEVRAWTITNGTPAVKAAGKIHSDLERGFIRAEVITYDDLTQCGSLAQARTKGLLRQEGKGYIVKDGDIITFLFNV